MVQSAAQEGMIRNLFFNHVPNPASDEILHLKKCPMFLNGAKRLSRCVSRSFLAFLHSFGYSQRSPTQTMKYTRKYIYVMCDL